MRHLSLFNHGELVEVAGWDGDWPPERELLRCVGRMTGIVTITSRTRLEETGIEEAAVRAVSRVTEFTLIQATASHATYHATI